MGLKNVSKKSRKTIDSEMEAIAGHNTFAFSSRKEKEEREEEIEKERGKGRKNNNNNTTKEQGQR